LQNLAILAQNGDESNIFQSHSGYMKVYPHRGYIIVLYTASQKSFDSTEFLIILKKDKRLVVELINGLGEENCIMLYEDEAKEYLKSHKVNLENLDEIFSKNYCQ